MNVCLGMMMQHRWSGQSGKRRWRDGRGKTCWDRVSRKTHPENKQLKPSAAGEKMTTAGLCCNNYKLWSLSKIAWLKSNILTRFNISTSWIHSSLLSLFLFSFYSWLVFSMSVISMCVFSSKKISFSSQVSFLWDLSRAQSGDGGLIAKWFISLLGWMSSSFDCFLSNLVWNCYLSK